MIANFVYHFRKVPGLNIPTNGTPSAPVSLNLNSAPPNQPTPPILNSTPDPESPPAPMSVLGENGLVVDPSTDGDWSYDPNEPRYCVCNQVSYGDMVACDNEAVSIYSNLNEKFPQIKHQFDLIISSSYSIEYINNFFCFQFLSP